MDVDKEIAALPEWPGLMQHGKHYYRHESAAALARLALLRDLVKTGDARLSRHTYWCLMAARERPTCTCGRDALIAALEPPK